MPRIKKFRVTMICREIFRAETIVEVKPNELSLLEGIKDEAWSRFNRLYKKDLEQENFTKVERIDD